MAEFFCDKGKEMVLEAVWRRRNRGLEG